MEKEKYYKYGFPNIIRKKNLISMQEIFNDVNVKSKLFTKKDENVKIVLEEKEEEPIANLAEEEEEGAEEENVQGIRKKKSLKKKNRK